MSLKHGAVHGTWPGLEWRRWQELGFSLGVVALLAWLLNGMGLFEAGRLMRGVSNLARFAQEMFPPDLRIVPTIAGALLETLQMAFAGTLLGFLLSFPLGVLGSRTLFPAGVVVVVRFMVAALRTVPSLLWAVLMVILVGLGPLAGTLALAFYTVGYLAKLYAELFEAIDPEILEAMRGVGAKRRHLIRFVLWPESANAILSQLLFMLEYNVRASTLLGLVGAGGIGFYMQAYLGTMAYARLSTVLLAVLLLVIGMDALSAWIRRRYLLRP
ncbi:phosphonate ABC transporter, permease protein PhnE [Thermoflexus sp.]|uniref:phosphonate ABC transporter, permease protein PhnE n=1 Tax=Thermoflexus sp. TaxID=1969742 RepID=UPI0035E464E1